MFNPAAERRPHCKINIAQGGHPTFMSPNLFSVSSSTTAYWACWARHRNIRPLVLNFVIVSIWIHVVWLKMCLPALFGLWPTESGYFGEHLCEHYSPNLRTLFPNCGCELTLGFYPHIQGILEKFCGQIWEYSSQNLFVNSLWPLTHRTGVFWREFVPKKVRIILLKFENFFPKTCLWAHTQSRYFEQSLCQNLRIFLPALHRSQIHYLEMREGLDLISSKLFCNLIWQLLKEPFFQFLSLSFSTVLLIIFWLNPNLSLQSAGDLKSVMARRKETVDALLWMRVFTSSWSWR